MQYSAKIHFGGPQFVWLLQLSLEMVKIFLWEFILVQKTYNVQVFCVNGPLIFGNFPFGREPQATARIYSLWLLSAAVNQH